MKRNKIAAGALALALGLGAVAPSFAADTKVSAEYTYDYKEAKEAFIKAWNELRAAEKTLKEAEANEAAAKKAYEEAVAELEAYHKQFEAAFKAVKAQFDIVYRQQVNFVQYDIVLKYTTGEDVKNAPKHVDDYTTLAKYRSIASYERTDKTRKELTEDELKALVTEYNNDIARLNGLIDDYNDLVDNTKVATLTLKVENAKKAYEVATEARERAEEAVKALTNDNKDGKYDKAKKALIKEGVGVDIINRAEKAGDITLIFEDKTPAKPVEKDEIKPETRAALEKAILDAKIQIKAVETLKKTTPKTIAKVVDKLDKLVKEAEATIKMSEELLGKKAAFNVVSTAYAADEEKSAEEKAKELTEKLNEKTKEIEDTLKENEANQPAEEETKPEEKPAEDKKDEEKPAEDKKEDKKEEKTTTTTKVVKKAGNNAKTGIAGVAGVAGVLAAASVAYAASKKNN